MGGPRLSVLLRPHALCVLLTLLGDGPQTTRASASVAACARWCPAHSTCVSATACRCDPGFTSSSGEVLTSPLETCDDINECGPPTPVSCGKFADCLNTEGSYHCTCSPGFELVSGGTTFHNESENTCQDIDECQRDPRICKSPQICVNTQGNYTCQCPPRSEISPEDPKLCKDANECTSGQNPCHKSTHCLNIVGSYRCQCRRGWKPIPGSPNGPNNTICEDVDECDTKKSQCHSSTFCENIPGSYKCLCLPGWVPKPGFRKKNSTAQCEEIVPPWTPPPGIKSQSLSHFFEKAKVIVKNQSASAHDNIKTFIKLLDELMETPGDLDTLSLPDRHRMATNLLSHLEKVLRALAKTIPGDNFIYHSPSDTELSLVIRKQKNETITMGQSHARMQLDWTEVAAAGDLGPAVAGILSSKRMSKLLNNASLELETEEKERLQELHESDVSVTRLELLSPVNTVFLSKNNTENLGSNVTFAFSYSGTKPRKNQELICAFWKSNHSGYWATTGCWKLGGNNSSITCQCSHLSSFAILMAHYHVEDVKLSLITKVGLALSLFCLLLCILTFLLVRPIQGSRTTLHLHLCICLFLGSAIFLAGIEKEGDEVELRCRLVAVLLHYCFLAAFCWMSLEGLELYFLVVRVFQGQGLSKPWLYLIGYGIPGLIVAISAAIKSEGYGHARYCWLDIKSGFIWSFQGPVIFIVTCNAFIFVITVWKLTQKFSEINPDMKKLKKARVLTITAVAQLLVLGCTWIFGLFLFNPRHQVLAYAFTVLNCLQGVFLFLLHCLLNKKVREEYWKWARRVTGNKYSEFATSTSGSSNNHQTRVLRPSESGM